MHLKRPNMTETCEMMMATFKVMKAMALALFISKEPKLRRINGVRGFREVYIAEFCSL